MHAQFFTGGSVTRGELRHRFRITDPDYLTRPFITHATVLDAFTRKPGLPPAIGGFPNKDAAARYFEETYLEPDGTRFRFKAPFFERDHVNEELIVERETRRLEITVDSTKDQIKAFDDFLKLVWKITNAVCLIKDDENGTLPEEQHRFYPRFDIERSPMFASIGEDWKGALRYICHNYFFTEEKHQPGWMNAARKKFSRLTRASEMLICGEDLGLLSPCVSTVMREFNILGLRVQRMPAEPEVPFYDPSNYPFDVVATTSTHDMPPLRQWWVELTAAAARPPQTNPDDERDRLRKIRIRDEFWGWIGLGGPPPATLSPVAIERIIRAHLASPAFLAIFPLQDLLAMTGQQIHTNPADEIINNPDNRKHYWQYRMSGTLEELLERSEVSAMLRRLMLDAGR